MTGQTLLEYLELWGDYGLRDLPLEKMAAPSVKTKSEYGLKPATDSKTSAKGEESRPRIKDLDSVRHWIGDCRRCGLCEGRNRIVFGNGNPSARLMFVGEGPGADEDLKGLPFVGRAGELLTRIIEAMGYRRNDVYIANVVKCRPPQNRTPLPDEIESCLPFLKSQIELVQPQIIVALGLVAANSLLGNASSMSSVRGRFQKTTFGPKIEVMPTYHPAYLLRNPAAKKLVWEDMKKVKVKLEGKS